MARYRSWDVPEDFWILQWRVRWARKLIMRIEGEPARKGDRGKRSATGFQRQVMDEMERYDRYPFTGPVALDLRFKTLRRNPPIIYNVAKNVLDLLGPALPGNMRPGRRSVLYRDDRQVKLLYVDLDQAWQPPGSSSKPTGDGSTFMTVQRARDAVADLCMAHRLSRQLDDEDDDEDGDPFRVPGLPDDLDMDWLPHTGRVPAALTQMQSFLADVARFHHVIDMQEAILARTDAILASGLCMYLEGLGGPEPPETIAGIIRDSHTASRDLLLSNPFTLPLPGLPQASGDEFADQARDQLEAFRTQHRLFRSLLVPVTLTFLVVPPRQGKDLDNIALMVLPIAHGVFKPHIQPHLFAPTHPGEPPEPWKQDAVQRLRSLNATSVTAYQVIELPRSPQDPAEGVLRLALGRHSHRSWWEKAGRYLDLAVKRAGQRPSYFDVEPWRGTIQSW